MKLFDLYSMMGHGGFLKMMAMIQERGLNFFAGARSGHGSKRNNPPGTRGNRLQRRVTRNQLEQMKLRNIGIELRHFNPSVAQRRRERKQYESVQVS